MLLIGCSLLSRQQEEWLAAVGWVRVLLPPGCCRGSHLLQHKQRMAAAVVQATGCQQSRLAVAGQQHLVMGMPAGALHPGELGTVQGCGATHLALQACRTLCSMRLTLACRNSMRG